jgi:hypothetical protein
MEGRNYYEDYKRSGSFISVNQESEQQKRDKFY